MNGPAASHINNFSPPFWVEGATAFRALARSAGSWAGESQAVNPCRAEAQLGHALTAATFTNVADLAHIHS